MWCPLERRDTLLLCPFKLEPLDFGETLLHANNSFSAVNPGIKKGEEKDRGF